MHFLAGLVVATFSVFLTETQSLGTLNSAGRMAPKGEHSDDSDEAVRLLFAYSRCFAHKRPSRADRILDLPLHSTEQEKAIRQYIAGAPECLGKGGTGLRIFAPSVVLAGLAEERFLRRHAKAAIQGLTTAASFVPRNDWEAFSLCIVKRNPEGARAILGIPTRSKDERAAVDKMVPDLSPCIPQGVQLKFDRYAIRSYVAVGLYFAGKGVVD